MCLLDAYWAILTAPKWPGKGKIQVCDIADLNEWLQNTDAHVHMLRGMLG